MLCYGCVWLSRHQGFVIGSYTFTIFIEARVYEVGVRILRRFGTFTFISRLWIEEEII